MEFAYFLDALEEEREQNITIDTTQTFFGTEEREYIIIDAPGHKEFLKNMITGVSQAEAAVLMVDVEQGLEEQTQRHAYILSMLGVKQVLVAMNKMDSVDFKQDVYTKVSKELNEFLGKIGVTAMHLIPLSARTGDNVVKRSEEMDWYDGPTLLGALSEFKTPEVLLERPLRLPVQDIYDVDGESVVVGRVESGKFKAGDEVLLLPQGEKQIVREIKVWNAQKSEASAGESIGLLLDDPSALSRGVVICAGDDTTKPVTQLDATIFWMAPFTHSKSDPLMFQCATQSVDCSIDTIVNRINSSTLEVIEEDGKEIGEAEAGKVVIKTKAPVLIEDFLEMEELGRFVLVKNDEIVAGGIIHT
jgi:sulfate adenylyltransferase subunit 1 (EFTu-like GTPase family)